MTVYSLLLLCSLFFQISHAMAAMRLVPLFSACFLCLNDNVAHLQFDYTIVTFNWYNKIFLLCVPTIDTERE